MAHDEDDQILADFLEESTEGLQRVEATLLSIESGAPPADGLQGMFRDLHTIKGTSGFLELTRVEKLAHAAEDLLGKLRNEEMRLTPDRVTLLLTVVDRARKQLEQVRRVSRDDSIEVADLVETLRREVATGDPPPAALACDEPDGSTDPATPSNVAAPAQPAAAANEPAPPAPIARTPGAADAVEVLVVDDDASQRASTRAALEGAHFRVVEADTGARALGMMRGLRPGDPAPTSHCAVVAISMPQMDGVELATRYLEAELPSPKIPVLLLARSPQEGDAALAQLAVPGVEYLVAPLDPEMLEAAVRGAIARAGAGSGRADGAKASRDDTSIRVGVGLLDRLMNLVGELVLARNQILQLAGSDKDVRINLLATAQRLNIVTSELQEQVMRTRMQPIARLFDQIPRMVRNITRQTGKEVVCRIDGNSTELDRTFIELMRDPLMHIVRNSLDHGIESPEQRRKIGKPGAGTLRVRAFHEGGNVNIEVEDDGGGIDPRKLRNKAVQRGLLTTQAAARLTDREALDLVFLPGLSTAEKVSQLSGRGVGMDVVRTHVERAGGQVELVSTLGKGTTLRLKIPMTLAIVPALLVKSGGQPFAIPQLNVLELVHVHSEQLASAIEHVRGAEIFRLRGTILPLVRLARVLGMTEPEETSSGATIVVLASGDRRYGLVVESVQDTVEIVVKSLHRVLKKMSCYSGATVLGDGSIALILDVIGLASMCHMKVTSGRASAATTTSAAQAETREPLLVFTAGDCQCAVPLALVSRIERIDPAKIERIAGREVLQYRSVIMPLVRPEDALGLPRSAPVEEQPIVVFDFGNPVGFAVSSIVDIVEADLSRTMGTERKGVLGTTVLLGKTSLVVDVHAVLARELPEHAFGAPPTTTSRKRAAVIEPSAMARAVLLGYVRSAGYEIQAVADDVAQLPSEESALEVVVLGPTPTSGDHDTALRRVRSKLPSVAVVSVASRGEQTRSSGNDAVQLDRDAIADALRRAQATTTQGKVTA